MRAQQFPRLFRSKEFANVGCFKHPWFQTFYYPNITICRSEMHMRYLGSIIEIKPQVDKKIWKKK